MAALRRVLGDACRSCGGAAVVRGEAGIGKTRLLAQILAHAEEQGFQVLSGTTDELAADRPFGALIEAFGLQADSADPQRAAIGRLITGKPDRLVAQTPVVAADLGFRIIDESVALLERLATDRPVVVAFEDLHWADPSTLRAVRAIGRALPDLPVALLVTLRPELDAALRAGLLAESAMGLTFRHELIREAIYHDVTPVLRQGLHREVARVLTAAGAPVGRVADHLYVGASAA
ncbi:MAG: ATP-binding protein, partial [Pseudonocardiaceae bacterium]